MTVAAELRRMIQAGELAAGARLRQGELAERFGSSTTPVREALVTLAREGLIHHDAHRGAIVFPPTLDDIRENFEIRLALEPLASGLAAPRLDDAELDGLERLAAALRAVAAIRAPRSIPAATRSSTASSTGASSAPRAGPACSR